MRADRATGDALYVLVAPPSALPSVTRRELDQAWEAARAGGGGGLIRGFRFAAADGAPVALILNDPDAPSWAAAVDRLADLSTARGASLCLRLIGLVELLARAEWARAWFSVTRGGARIAPALLQAAALSPLLDTGGFDEAALRALLPVAAPRE